MKANKIIRNPMQHVTACPDLVAQSARILSNSGIVSEIAIDMSPPDKTGAPKAQDR